ncbi:peptidase inhibitor family I36 protein [Longispora sp. K20-0274]|uniref:peptidase inhibitor family I36 protein n=1 Tax=Longispora sp. K20-0274 TaxID=3088255 RepID=UPI00399B9950
MKKFLRRAAVIGVATAAVAAGTLTAAAPAQAANACPFPYFCLYYNSNQQGAVAFFYNADPNFYNDTFSGSGAGAGQGVKNNAASAKNNQTGIDAWVWFNSNYGGAHDVVTRSSSRNLTATYNNNASFDWHN